MAVFISDAMRGDHLGLGAKQFEKILAASKPGVTLRQVRISPEVLRSGWDRLVTKNLKITQRPSVRFKPLLPQA